MSKTLELRELIRANCLLKTETSCEEDEKRQNEVLNNLFNTCKIILKRSFYFFTTMKNFTFSKSSLYIKFKRKKNDT